MPDVSENKWPDFEKAFLGFKPAKLAFQPDEFWGALMDDKRIVHNGAKIMSVRDNAQFVQSIAKDMAALASSLRTGRRRTRSVCSICSRNKAAGLAAIPARCSFASSAGEGFVTSKDVVACLRDAGLDIAVEVKSKGDLAKVQAAFNAWAEETNLPYAHLSRICALSVGENYQP